MLSKNKRQTIPESLVNQKRSDLGQYFAKLHRQLQQTKKSMLIIVEGWESSGKGFLLKDLTRELDPRYFKVRLYEEATPRESKYPYLRRFFLNSPQHGQIMFFNHSYYFNLLTNPDCPPEERAHLLADIKFIEEALHNDDTLVLKFFLHQSRSELANNIQALEKDPYRHVRLTELDYQQLKNYHHMFEHFNDVLKATNSADTPWHILHFEGQEHTSRYALQACIEALQEHLETDLRRPEMTLNPLPSELELPLSAVDLTKAMNSDEYNSQLEKLQKRAGDLLYQTYIEGKHVIVVYEGTDAAGKGGNIQRLTRFMDPRGYDVSTVAAPSQLENSHHYLWRFYRDFPYQGRMTIFDRSWYGRVLVERVEGFTPKYRWQEAYHEINQLEQDLALEGVLVLKYFIVIDKAEQKKRFEARAADPEKIYKLTDEDWRNHEKFDYYTHAMNEMLVRTSTEAAPWLVVPGTDKQYARIMVIKDFIARMEAYLDGE